MTEPSPPFLLRGWRLLGGTVAVLAATGVGRSIGMGLASAAWPPPEAHPEALGLIVAIGLLAGSALGGVALWLLLRRREPRAYLAVVRPTGPQLLLGLIGSVLLVILFDLLRLASAGSAIPASWPELAASAPVPLLVLAFVGAAPLFEELFFRGFLHSSLRATRLGPAGAVAVISLFFAAAHGPTDLISFLDPLATAIFLGVLRERTRTIVPGILAHAFGNLQAIVVALAAVR